MNPDWTETRTKIFVISDHHFNHEKIIELANRHFTSLDQMNELMIFYWNQVVRPNDVVIHLGDLAMGSTDSIKAIIPRLNGTIFLIRGNHDRGVNFYTKNFPEKVKVLPHAYELQVGGFLPTKGVIFSHKPLAHKDIPKGWLNFHGHYHSKNPYENAAQGYVNMTVEGWGYNPTELHVILNSTQHHLNKISQNN